jgi:hypothetical protein
MQAPIQLKFDHTTHTPHLKAEAEEWKAFGKAATLVEGFDPWIIKALYVTGIMSDIFRAVTILLEDSDKFETTYLPAYLVFASGVELLGRCINGNKDPRLTGVYEQKIFFPDLKTGFKWLASPSYPTYKDVADCHILVQTNLSRYNIELLTTFRNFVAHGQASAKEEHISRFGFDVLGKMPPLVTKGLEMYWDQLYVTEDLCTRLARASIFKFSPAKIIETLLLYGWDENGKRPNIGKMFADLDWIYKSPIISADLDAMLSGSSFT